MPHSLAPQAAATSVVVAAYLVTLLGEYTDVADLAADPEAAAGTEGGCQALAVLQLVSVLGAQAGVLLAELAERSIAPATVLLEGTLLAGAGLGTLTGGVLEVDPGVRSALLVAVSTIVGGMADAVG